MKTILVYSPFCTPASPSYSINYLASFLNNNGQDVTILDLNLKFHEIKYPEYQEYYQKLKSTEYDKNEYNHKTKQFQQLTSQDYSENNKKVIKGEDPELLNELLAQIMVHKPTSVAFSIVYSSQAFYTLALLKRLKGLGIKTIIGGPAINEKLKQNADKTLKNEVELLEEISGKDVEHQKLNSSKIINYKNLNNYFVPHPVVPIKTSNACYYQQCAFCTHHGQVKYQEFKLEDIKQTIINSGQKRFFFIDDMISKKRLLAIAELIQPLNISWMCQLRPTKDLDKETLETLYRSGLKIILWGVESGSDRILKVIRKGTNIKDIPLVLKNSQQAGIKNVLYIMFGFPTETKEEFMSTIEFLEQNKDNIDLISTSTFGLQKEAPAYKEPETFGIIQIKEKERTVLEPKITYQVKEGLTPQEVVVLRKRNQKRIIKLNKFPKNMNYFREQMLCLV